MAVTGNGNICMVTGTTAQGWRGLGVEGDQFVNTPVNPIVTEAGKLWFTP